MEVLQGSCKPAYEQERPEKAVLNNEGLLRRPSKPVEVPGNLEKSVFSTVEVQ